MSREAHGQRSEAGCSSGSDTVSGTHSRPQRLEGVALAHSAVVHGGCVTRFDEVLAHPPAGHVSTVQRMAWWPSHVGC